MKIMDVSIEEKDCTIEMVTPPRKKMKQAQLPFQMVGALGSSGKTSNKKRKLDSPSPVEMRSPKTGREVKKPNAAKRVKGSDVEVIEVCLSGDEEEEVDQETIREESKEGAAAKRDEKVEKAGETDGKKKKDYGMLSMFLKKAQNKESKDDIHLLAMSDYESGNSKDSDASLKSKLDSQNAKENSEESLPSNKTEKENNGTLPETSLSDAKPEKATDSKTGDDDNEDGALEIANLDTDLTSNKKESVTSDDNDAKNVDSDSDIGGLSSDDDPDDDQDKSSNENVDKDKNSEENDGSKTPRNERSTPLRNRKLTPKQIERRIQSAKKREEKQRLKEENQKKREEERENRRKEKEEKRREKEEKERVEKEQKRKEKEMKELKKQMETEQKQKEKEAKEEERRKREEEKLEAERKKQKAASNFANFFVPKKQENKAAEEENVVKDQNFMPFEVKVDMRIAPITRRNLDDENKLSFEGLFNKGISQDQLYLSNLKQNPGVIGRSKQTWPYEAKDDIVIIDEDDGSDAVDPGSAPITEKHHPKLFLFAENRRPPFWGTWRKKSDHISPRRPFAKDSKWFDYDVDSDDEWEEEEPGESIRGSDDERDDEGPEENEYDVDNDFMVPHGYLSDEEAKADEEDGEDMSPETQKLKLKILGEQFEAERKTKTSKIKPKVIGCVWQGSVNAYPENTAPNVVQILKAREAWVRDIPIVLSGLSSVSEIIPQSTTDCGSPATPMTGAKKKRVPEEAIPNLIRLVHGNINGRIFLIKEFMEFWEKNKTGDRQISKLSLSQKIKEIASWIACPEEGPMHLRSCWYVREEVRKEYNCLEVTLPNRWDYALRPTRRIELPDIDKPDKIDREKKRIPLITQFTKKITQEEMQKQLVVGKPNTSVNKPPKRVALISVPRGEQIQQSSRNNLTSKFATSGDSERVEIRGNEPLDAEKIPVVQKPREINKLDYSEPDKVEVTQKESANDKINDQTHPEGRNSGGETGTEVVDGPNSMCDKSRVALATETEEDNVIVLED